MGRFLSLQPRRPDRAAHGYVYYRWTTAYMAVVRYFLERGLWAGGLRRAAGRYLERTHHAKVVPLADAKRTLTIARSLDWRDLECVVPFATARDIIVDAPPRIALAECACRAVAEREGERDGSCGSLEQCIYIGDPIASFVVEKQPSARFVTSDEALAVVEEAARRGDVHTLWFKDAADERMYAICNCCSCCCIGLKSVEAGFHPLAGSGYVASVDPGLCTACVDTCAFRALAVPEGSAAVVIDEEACLGCGACVGSCPSDALSLARATTGPAPLPWDGL